MFTPQNAGLYNLLFTFQRARWTRAELDRSLLVANEAFYRYTTGPISSQVSAFLITPSVSFLDFWSKKSKKPPHGG